MFGSGQKRAVRKVFNKRTKDERRLEARARKALEGMRAAAALVPGLDAEAAIRTDRRKEGDGIILRLVAGEAGGHGIDVCKNGKYLVYTVNAKGEWNGRQREVEETRNVRKAAAIFAEKMMDSGYIPVETPLLRQQNNFRI